MLDKNLNKPGSNWELESPTPFEGPSLESVLDRISKVTEAPNGIQDNLYREKTTSDTSVHIRSMPRMVWNTIKYISYKHPGKLTNLKSVAEGCLIHCGLNVLEGILAEIPGTKKVFIESYERGDTAVLGDFIGQYYKTEHTGHGIGQTRKVFFLNSNDVARAMEISNDYGTPVSQVVIIAMVAGIAKSESFLPRYTVKAAQKDVGLFRRAMKGTKFIPDSED